MKGKKRSRDERSGETGGERGGRKKYGRVKEGSEGKGKGK